MESLNSEASGWREPQEPDPFNYLPDPSERILGEDGLNALSEHPNSSQQEEEHYSLPLNPDDSVDWDEVTGTKYLLPPFSGDEPPFSDKPPTPEA